MTKKKIGVCIVLSIVTFGIYGIYWFITLNNTVNELADPPKKTSGGVAFLLTIVTCSIYGWFWAYKMGGLIDEARTKHGLPTEGHGGLYLLLQVLGLGLVGWAMMQNSINPMLPDADNTAA